MFSQHFASDLPDRIDALIAEQLHRNDGVMATALAFHRSKPVPKINVPPSHGKFLHFLVQMMGAKHILEIGTLAGYSTLWLAKDLPAGGEVVTIDFDPKHVALAAQTFAMAGVQDRITQLQGVALDCLCDLQAAHARGERPAFDFVFIDADKENNPHYLEAVLPMCRSGTVIVADNVVRDGKILTESDRAPNIRGLRRYLQQLGEDPRLDSTVIQTMGHKGWDGFAITRVK